MCGISGIVGSSSNTPERHRQVRRMMDVLAHRGPDGEGFLWMDPAGNARSTHDDASTRIPDGSRVAAAFRWLKIQDLDARSRQPMPSRDSRAWILFNGEIYNHGALRAELEALGEQFATRSDTEVALAAYRRWGTSAFARC